MTRSSNPYIETTTFLVLAWLVGGGMASLSKDQWWFATLTAVPLRLGSNPAEDMDVCKYIVPSRHGGTLNSRQAASPPEVGGRGREAARDDDRFGVMAKILVFGTEGTRTESSFFIGDPDRAKRTPPFSRSCHGAVYPPQKQPSLYTTNDVTHTSRHARMTQLLTR
ncbi:hypothetical protein TNCV_1708891 [Trichonephila clavipes]|nr:hypothetical protein TNCV_1708891 [Trichonephila clavipes]